MRDEKELTWPAIVLGCLLAVVFGAANAYLGLRVGLTVSASVPAAVVSMGVMRFLLKRNSMVEHNMVQTIGSAGESLAAGAIFTMPALYLWADEGICAAPGFVSLTIIALAGGVLGVLFMVPLRKPLIVDEEKILIYPEGRACAEVIKAGEKGGGHAGVVFLGVVGSVLLKLVIDLFKWIPASLSLPFRRLRGEIGIDLSPALAGVGFIVGPKISAILFSGSFLGWMVLIPIFCLCSDAAAADYASGGAVAVWKAHIRFIGAGAIAMGGFYSLLKSIPLFVQTFRESFRKSPSANSSAGVDLPMKRVAVGVVAVIALIALVPAVPVGVGGALLIALFGFFFATVSARMVGLVGSSNNPVSGMTIATLVVSAFALKACGTAGAAGMVASIAIGSIVCIVAAIAGDTAQDLKTGRILGATPWKQQVGEFIGVAASGLAIAGVLLLLHRAWGFGGDEIPAPQAMLMKVVVEGIMGGTLPWHLLAIGAGIAVVVIMLRVPVMPFAIGIYLPIKLNVAIMLGGVLRVLSNRYRPDWSDRGVLLSAGLIAGEGICGIILAVVSLLG